MGIIERKVLRETMRDGIGAVAMKHDFPPNAWSCARCRMPVARAAKEPFCVPDDGATFVAALAERPSDTEMSDAR